MHRDQNEYRILLIEDNPGDVLIIEELLTEQIFSPRITVATHYREAENMLLSGEVQFDVILLDLTLPDKNGKALVTAMLLLAPAVPIIVLTGYADADFSLQSISLGISDYLVKDELVSSMLYKSIVYCIERKKKIQRIGESEKRYSELFHLSPQPMWVYDPENLRFIQVNKAAIDHYGYSEEEFLRMTILDIRPPEDYERIVEFMKDVERQEKHFKGRFKHHTKQRALIDVEVFSSAITVNDKKMVLVVINDITEKLATESNITRAIIKAQEDERYEIGAELHDNICQLLVASLIKVELLRKEIPSHLLPVLNECKELLTFTNSEIRNVSHRLAPAFFDNVDLEDAFKSLIKTLELEKRFSVSVYFGREIEKKPIKRELQLNLYRILQEQLKNIIKYSEATTVNIAVNFFGDMLQMTVSDNGVGFDIQHIKTGIGLSNIKRRAELFSGMAKIISSPGAGCAIIIVIPLAAAVNCN